MTLSTDARGFAFPVFCQFRYSFLNNNIPLSTKISTIAFIFYFDEACLTDDLMGYPNKPLQKKSSAPFGSKAGTLTTLNLMLWRLLYV